MCVPEKKAVIPCVKVTDLGNLTAKDSRQVTVAKGSDLSVNISMLSAVSAQRASLTLTFDFQAGAKSID